MNIERLVSLVRRGEGLVNSFLVFLSVLGVALVVVTELVPNDAVVPYLHCSWATFQVLMRTGIWAAFALNFVTFALISGRPLHYLRTHVLEAVICVTWVPHYTDGSIKILTELFSLTQFVPLDMLQVVGTLAHAWRVTRYTSERFEQHPIIVTGGAGVLLIGTSAALLNYFEPLTFHSFWDAAWFSLTTVTTIGYGDLTPHTPIGRWITTGLILSGISLFGVVLGLISEMVRTKLLKQHPRPDVLALTEEVERLARDLAQTREAIDRMELHAREHSQMLRTLVEQRQGATAPAPVDVVAVPVETPDADETPAA